MLLISNTSCTWTARFIHWTRCVAVRSLLSALLTLCLAMHRPRYHPRLLSILNLPPSEYSHV